VNRRKELQEAYKQMKPDMGIFMIQSLDTKKCTIEVDHNMKAKMNRRKIQLQTNGHPVLELQQEWNQYGEDNFNFEVLEQLKYGKDEDKTDYSEELAILLMVWEEKLTAENVTFYKKRLK